MEERIREFWFKRGIDVKCSVTPEIITWWLRRFHVGQQLSPKDLCAFLVAEVGYRQQFKLLSADPSDDAATVMIQAFSDADRVYLAQRSVEFLTEQVHQNYLEIFDAYQGLGIGTVLARNSIRLAKQLNLKRVGVSAVDTGSYVWARAGFLPEVASWQDNNCLGKILGRLESLDGIDWRLRDQIYARLVPDHPDGIWFISDLKQVVPSIAKPGMQLPIGKALLIESGATWHGHLELQTSDGQPTRHYRRAIDYLGL